MSRLTSSPFLITFALIACAAWPLSANAGDRPLTFAEAVRLAVSDSPRVQAQSAAVEAAQAEVGRADALPDPMLIVGVENLPVTGGNAFDFAVDEMTMKRIGVRQEFPATAKRVARRALAARKADRAQAGVVTERLAVQRAAADAWVDTWSAGREIQAVEALRDQARLAAKLAHARASGGADSAVEALAVDASVLELEIQLESARVRQAVAVAALRRWVEVGEPVTIDGAPDFYRLPLASAVLAAHLEDLAPLLDDAAALEVAAAEVAAARAEKRLDWSLTAAYGQRDHDRSDMLSVEVEVALPVFASRRQDRGILAREAEYRRVFALREDRRREVASQVEAGVARWQAMRRQVALHEDRLLPLARDRSAIALARYRAGGELQPWLDARAAELNVRRLHAEHLGDLGHAWAALAFLLPEGTP